MQLSIVTTLYMSAAHVRDFCSRVTTTAQAITDDYEIILVNDGSPDNSLQLALEIHQADEHIKVIDLARNFGHHKAIMAGLGHSLGDRVFLIDADLEEQPELLATFWQRMDSEQDVDVIYGVQKNRKGNLFERISGGLFYSAFNALSGVKLPRNFVTARLMSRRYLIELLKYREHELFLGGLFPLVGYRQLPVEIEKYSSSGSTYSLRKKLVLFVNAITAFSNTPLYFIFWLGFLVMLLSFAYASYVTLRKIFLDVAIDGWTSLIVSVWFLGGMLTFSIGVVGIYLSKVFIETKNRPYVTIKKTYERSG